MNFIEGISQRFQEKQKVLIRRFSENSFFQNIEHNLHNNLRIAMERLINYQSEQL